ncbi:hypothetical protein K474DRAFT_1038884 [Panus rudis PR-1116 ss-1]|nr:hypothetical protein K474DRAFT_1038884 [Panus rudis PR-1116 ss-1]
MASPAVARPLPPSPSKKDVDLRPNPHAYAIRTTSTALLTRSNSTGFNINATRHYYVPSSPSPVSNHQGGRYHRSTQSQPTNFVDQRAPRPLPVPPSFPSTSNGYVSADDAAFPPRRVKRADTLPSQPAPYSPAPVSVTLEDLPSNPKLWTPSQLASYLMTALRVTGQNHDNNTSGLALPVRFANDIATFVKDVRMTGRTFLRLNEEDLISMNVNKKWREALLIASRNLRQNVLKGRIWGPDSDGPSSPGSTSPMPAHPFSSSLYNSSSSSVDLTSEPEESDIKPRRYRNGRVRGMVESLERSGSFSSESGCDEAATRDGVRRWIQEEGPVQDEVIPSPTHSTFSPPEYHPPPRTIQDEEPTIEDLLAAEGIHEPKQGSWGARAWEELDLAPGVTVKRVSESTFSPGTTSFTSPQWDEGSSTVIHKGSGKGSGGRGRGRGRDEKRIVTAIFSPSKVDGAFELSTDLAPPQTAAFETQKVDGHVQTEGVVADIPPTHLNTNDVDILRDELTQTRALLDAFRSRLEVVETKLVELEKRDAERERERRAEEEHVTHPVNHVTPLCAPASSPYTPMPSEESSPSFLSQATSLVPALVQQFTSTTSGRASNSSSNRVRNNRHSSEEADEDENEPTTVADLSSYVFLVGVGVCAVVLRVMFRKVGGRTSLGWKT